MLLENKVSLITGAGQGIGREIAMLFAKEGSQIVVNNIDLEKATSVAIEINKYGGFAIPFKADIAQAKEVGVMIEKTIEKFGHIDILVNNAGIQTRSPFLDLSVEDWNRVMEVNLKGTFLCSQLAAREMVKKGKGKIINISSIHQSIPRYNKAHYDASKAGIAMLTKDMALELARYKINVNGIAPGAIATPMNEDILKSPEKIAEMNLRIPWGRMGHAKDVANVALFLASDRADYITGTTILVDGGLSLNAGVFNAK